MSRCPVLSHSAGKSRTALAPCRIRTAPCNVHLSAAFACHLERIGVRLSDLLLRLLPRYYRSFPPPVPPPPSTYLLVQLNYRCLLSCPTTLARTLPFPRSWVEGSASSVALDRLLPHLPTTLPESLRLEPTLTPPWHLQGSSNRDQQVYLPLLARITTAAGLEGDLQTSLLGRLMCPLQPQLPTQLVPQQQLPQPSDFVLLDPAKATLSSPNGSVS